MLPSEHIKDTNIKMQENSAQEVIKKGSIRNFKGDNKIFSGDVSVEIMFVSNAWRDFSGGLVTFAPKARSAWHMHPKGQTLIVIDGSIITATKDGSVSIANKGDVISCPPNVEHFHGALDSKSGSHIALTGEVDGKNVTWLEKINDKEYEKFLKDAKKNKK